MRDKGNTDAFLKHLVEAYGQWPKLVITDGGPWYEAAFSFWQVEGGDHLEDCPRRCKVCARGVLRGIPQKEDQGLRPLFPHKKERLGWFEEVASELRLAPQPHQMDVFNRAQVSSVEWLLV